MNDQNLNHEQEKPHINKKMRCHICKRRVFDLSDVPEKEIKITIKCPRCKKLVAIPLQ